MSRATGDLAEEAAAEFLRGMGFAILERNWRLPLGEIDIVAKDGDTIVFVEVKARAGASFGGAAAAVGPAKRAKLIRAAKAYAHSKGLDCPMRFDVVAIDAGVVEHIPDAFTA